jgi:hypothetical protein
MEIEIVAGTTDIAALSDTAVSAVLCAVTLTELEGTVLGALYKPDEVMVPTAEFPPTAPFTSQFTAVLLVPETVALNC